MKSVVVIALALGLTAARVHAQPRGPDDPREKAAAALLAKQAEAAPPPTPQPPATMVQPQAAHTPATDIDSGSGVWMAILFWTFALVAVGGSLFVITRRNLIAAVMGMVGTFFALAVLYMMLYASFLAVIQMLVYAGAIMVLFVFVVMVLNKPEDEAIGRTGLPGKALAVVAMGYLLLRFVLLVWSVTPQNAKGPDAAMKAPEPVVITYKAPPVRPDEPVDQTGMANRTETYDFGSTAAVGNNLFHAYVFPFEAISVLLLIAVVGAIAIARPMKDDQP